MISLEAQSNSFFDALTELRTKHEPNIQVQQALVKIVLSDKYIFFRCLGPLTRRMKRELKENSFIDANTYSIGFLHTVNETILKLREEGDLGIYPQVDRYETALRLCHLFLTQYHGTT